MSHEFGNAGYAGGHDRKLERQCFDQDIRDAIDAPFAGLTQASTKHVAATHRLNDVLVGQPWLNGDAVLNGEIRDCSGRTLRS